MSRRIDKETMLWQGKELLFPRFRSTLSKDQDRIRRIRVRVRVRVRFRIRIMILQDGSEDPCIKDSRTRKDISRHSFTHLPHLLHASKCESPDRRYSHQERLPPYCACVLRICAFLFFFSDLIYMKRRLSRCMIGLVDMTRWTVRRDRVPGTYGKSWDSSGASDSLKQSINSSDDMGVSPNPRPCCSR